MLFIGLTSNIADRTLKTSKILVVTSLRSSARGDNSRLLKHCEELGIKVPIDLEGFQMVADVSNCPKCHSVNIYQDRSLWVCPECSHEWTAEEGVQVTAPEAEPTGIRDANGQLLKDGDSVVVVKDLKIKGSSGVVKGGTKVRNIRLADAGDGHDIVCKIDGLGQINLKSEFVRKA